MGGLLHRPGVFGPFGFDGPLLAVTVFSLGRFGDGGNERQTVALDMVHAAVAADPAWEPAGPARRFGYSSPFVPRDQRYWEVQVPVRAVDLEADGAPAAPAEGT